MDNNVGQLMSSVIAGFTQERVECSVGEGRIEHLVPTVFWVLHPLCVVIWIALFGLGQAKLAFLIHVEFYTMFMVMSLQKAGGFEYQDIAYGAGGFQSFLSLFLCS